MAKLSKEQVMGGDEMAWSRRRCVRIPSNCGSPTDAPSLQPR